MDPCKNIVKKEDSQEENDMKCPDCEKVFSKQANLSTHLKLKHPAEAENPKPQKNMPKNRVLEAQQNEHEDIIYAYLGQLGERNQEAASARPDISQSDDPQKMNGQNNYSTNKVVRTPYEKQIDPIEAIPKEIVQKSKFKELFLNFSQQMTIFHKKVELEKQKWQFRDPMAPEEETQDQFSLMDIRKLLRNYPRRNIKAKYPHFCVFMLWTGRICKSSAWQEIFLVIGEFLGLFYEWKKENEEQDIEQFGKIFQEKEPCLIKSESYEICDSKTIKKLIEYFVRWVVLFEMKEFC